jgi:hypothetical protein
VFNDHRIGHYYDNPPNASPDKASNGRKVKDHPCDGPPSQRTPKQLKASTFHHATGKGIPINGYGNRRTTKIWPKNMMAIIKAIVLCGFCGATLVAK